MPELRMGLVAAVFTAGIVAADHKAALLCLLAVGLPVALAAVLTRRLKTLTPAILIAVFALGAGDYAARLRISPNDISRHARGVSAFEGTVASDPEAMRDRVRLVFRVDKIKMGKRWHGASGDVMVTIYESAKPRASALAYGDRACIIARPYLPLEPTNPGQFSYRSYLARQGIYACASIRRPMQISRLTGRGGSPLVAAAISIKHYLDRSIHKLHSPHEASLISGVILGSYSYLPEDTFRDFSRTGTLHILAASGYNCYIVLLLATPILVWLRVLPKGRSIVVALLILLYLLMVGPKPSLLRAAIMASMLLLAAPLKRVPNLTNLFFTAGLVLLAINPSDLFEVGFQLSFLSVGALIFVYPILKKLLSVFVSASRPGKRRAKWYMPWIERAAGNAAAAAVGTTAITLVTAPLVAYYFNYFSLVSIPANIATAMLVPLIFVDALLSAAFAPIALVGQAVGFLGAIVTRTMLAIVDYLGSLSHAAVSVPSPSPLSMLGYYIVLVAGIGYLRSRIVQD